MPPITAAVMPGPLQPVELREFPEPEIAPGGMLIRTLYSEVCGTDVHLWHGRLSGGPYPIIPGHVSVGLVDKLRGDVTGGDGHRFREGDGVDGLDEALADAEAMRLPKALVSPRTRRRG